MPGPFTFPVAQSVPFEPNRITAQFPSGTGIISENVQDAIEETKYQLQNVARFAISCGFDGTASAGRYLEFITNIASNASGFVTPRNTILAEISLVTQSNNTGTVQIIEYTGTETVIASISLSSARKSAVTNLNVSLNALSEIRIKVSSGSLVKPMVYMFLVFV